MEGSEASRKSSWATMEAESTSSTSPFRQMMRSLRRREKMSEVWMPPWTVSVTKGMGRAALGWFCCWRVALWVVGGKGWKVVMLRRRWVGRVLWTAEAFVRRARRVERVMGSIVGCGCVLLNVVVGWWCGFGYVH